MKISNFIKSFTAAVAITTAPIAVSPQLSAQAKNDTFERVVSPMGTTDSLTLENAPSPNVKIQGKMHKAVIVVDIKHNTLYKYNKEGKAEKAYLVATGAPGTPSKKIVGIVSHVEKFPYKYAPANSKRIKNPYPYGAKIIILDKIDSESGEITYMGQWIHGNNKASSIGKQESGGCIRMDNEVIKELSSQVKHGDIVLFK